jgi:signal peptidase I
MQLKLYHNLLLRLIQSSIVLLLLYLTGRMFYFNSTISEPRGYYFAYSSTHYSIGDMVLICINNKHYINVLKQLGLPTSQSTPCPQNMPFLLKKIVAKAGDTINITNYGIVINNQSKPYPQSQALEQYKNIQLLSQANGTFLLKANEYFMLGETPHSYDSRYFGVVYESQIFAKAVLLLRR